MSEQAEWRVDERRIEAGEMIDRARARRLAAKLGIAERDAVFVKVMGRTALRCEVQRGAVSGVRCGHVWRDVLGYDWELAYTLPEARWEIWHARI